MDSGTALPSARGPFAFGESMSKEITAQEATKLMRALSEEEREEAIYSSDNVIGYDRFVAVRNQVDLRERYRKPKGED